MADEKIYENDAFAKSKPNERHDSSWYEQLEIRENSDNTYSNYRVQVSDIRIDVNGQSEKEPKGKSEEFPWKKIILLCVILSSIIAFIQILIAAFVMNSIFNDHSFSKNNEEVLGSTNEFNKTIIDSVLNEIKMKTNDTDMAAKSIKEQLFSYITMTDSALNEIKKKTNDTGMATKIIKERLLSYSTITDIALSDIIATVNRIDETSNTTKIEFGSLTGIPLRLVGGGSEKEGRVEVFYNGSWGTVCDDGWDNNDATVVCKQVGYRSGTSKTSAYFGQGTGPILMDDVSCIGQ